MRKIGAAIVVGTIVLVVGASLSFGASAKSAAANSAAKYTLKEMSLVGPATVASGQVTLTARNGGTVEHELVVFKGIQPLTLKNFKGVESGRALGEIPETAPGKTGSVTLTLKAGKYLLACNIVGHYQLGMHRTLTVK